MRYRVFITGGIEHEYVFDHLPPTMTNADVIDYAASELAADDLYVKDEPVTFRIQREVEPGFAADPAGP